jgi:tetratricopeptide (TPR) repeat protein
LQLLRVPLLALLILPVVPLLAQVPAPADQQASEIYDTGMRLLREKRYAEALEQFQQEEKVAPTLPQGAVGEGIALALLGRLPESNAALNRALQIDPTDWMARRELGIVEWQLNQKDAAAKDLAQIVKLFPTDPAANSILGQYELERGNYAQSSAYFAAAPAQVAASPKLRLMDAEALLKTGRPDEAKEQLAGLGDQPGLTADEKVRLGWLLGQAKEYPEAIQVFNSVPADYPDQRRLRYGLALAYFEQGDNARSIDTLKDYTSPGATTAAILSLMGVAQEKSGNTEEANKLFQQGIDQFPADDESYLDLATLGAVHLNYDIALPALAAGMEKMPGDYRLYLASGLLHNLKGLHDVAEGEYRKALALAPDQSSIYVALGMCYEDEDKYSDAVAILRQAIDRQIKDVLVYYFLADALFRQGIAPNTPKYEQAQSAVEAGLKIDPGYAFSYLQRAKLELMANRTDDAIADLEHARTLESNSQPILYQLATAYRRVGRKSEADKLFASVVETNKKEGEEERVRTLEGIMVGMSAK